MTLKFTGLKIIISRKIYLTITFPHKGYVCKDIKFYSCKVWIMFNDLKRKDKIYSLNVKKKSGVKFYLEI